MISLNKHFKVHCVENKKVTIYNVIMFYIKVEAFPNDAIYLIYLFFMIKKSTPRDCRYGKFKYY